jgi:pyridoxine 4-dehydrogenase
MTETHPLNGTRKLTLADVEVGRIGLGTNRLTKTPEHVDFVKQAIGAGVSVIDTAHTYAGGGSEKTIGAALGPIPNEVVVATKGGWETGRPEAIRAEIEESLRRLRADAITLYYLHRPDPGTPIEESIGAINEARDEGKIRHVGLSNVGVDLIERGRRIVPVAAVQNHYSLSEREHDEVVDYCARERIVFVPYFPLRGVAGVALDEIAERHGASTAQIALAWLLRRSSMTLPIPGTLSLAHLEENIAALSLELTDEEFRALP